MQSTNPTSEQLLAHARELRQYAEQFEGHFQLSRHAFECASYVLAALAQPQPVEDAPLGELGAADTLPARAVVTAEPFAIAPEGEQA